MKDKKLEILAPAGSMESLKAAIQAGADAVYMGGNRFGARAYANNPEGDQLLEAIQYTHFYGKKFYLTINTLLKNKELEQELYEYLKPCYEQGLDAVLIQDFGVLDAVHAWFPDLDLHASTQMNLCGADGVKFLEDKGVKRVVLARELSLEEIADIHRQTHLEIECFVHGALCYCYSGQCLFSSLLGGRSGNRGRCAQPCRLSYGVLSNGKFISQKGGNTLLSPKDICTLELLPEIVKAGVCSLKIEGRMKRPEYTAGITRIYRKYVDRYLEKGDIVPISDKDKKELLLLFNRDGFSSGYYHQHNGRDLIALNHHKLSVDEKKEYEDLIRSLNKRYLDKNQERKFPIDGILYAKAGQPVILTIQKDHTEVTVKGNLAQYPKNCSMSQEMLEKQLQKVKDTPFYWENLKIHLEGPVFVPVKDLNHLRREGLEKLQNAMLASFIREAKRKQQQPDRILKKSEKTVLHISVESEEQLDVILSNADGLKEKAECPLTAIYLDAESLEEKLPELVKRVHHHGLRVYVNLPAIFRKKTTDRYQKNISNWSALDTDGYIIKNLEEFYFLKENLQTEKEKLLDFSMYTWNLRSRAFWRKEGVYAFTNPLELNFRELKEISEQDSIQVIYGRYPMMVTAGCLHKTLKQCQKKPEKWMLLDRYQKKFPVKNYCRDCYNIIYNSQPLHLFHHMEELSALGVGAYRIMFTDEDGTGVESVLTDWLEGFIWPKQIEFTKGHFRRGVE